MSDSGVRRSARKKSEVLYNGYYEVVSRSISQPTRSTKSDKINEDVSFAKPDEKRLLSSPRKTKSSLPEPVTPPKMKKIIDDNLQKTPSTLLRNLSLTSPNFKGMSSPSDVLLSPKGDKWSINNLKPSVKESRTKDLESRTKDLKSNTKEYKSNTKSDKSSLKDDKKSKAKSSLFKESLDDAKENCENQCELSINSENSYQNARKALHNSFPTNLPGRQTELNELRRFIREHLENETSGTLYVSGPPGTGKTASLSMILQEKEFSSAFKQIYVNCTAIKSSGYIYATIVKELGIKAAGRSEKENLAAIERYLSKNHKMILLVLDEMDQLESKKQSVLYSIFEWPAKPNSKLILVGIANALDLTDRILPRLQARCELKPKLMHFAPYSKQQIVEIFTNRLQEAKVLDIFAPSALQMLAGKVAAVSGDVRRALDIGRRVVELVDKDKRSVVLKSVENLDCLSGVEKNETESNCGQEIDRIINQINNDTRINNDNQDSNAAENSFENQNSINRSSNRKNYTKINDLKNSNNTNRNKNSNDSSSIDSNSNDSNSNNKSTHNQTLAPNTNQTNQKTTAKTVNLSEVMSVLNKVYGTAQTLDTEDSEDAFPLQQKLVICTLLLILKKAKNKDVTIGKLHEVYRKVCAKRNLLAVDQAEFVGMCSLIEARGIIRVTGKKERRLNKVSLEWDEDEVSACLKDKQLLSAVLQDDSCLGKM